MIYRKQYDFIVPDFEEVAGDYLVDDTGYESISDLLARCIRDGRPLPDRTPGLVEDFEVGDNFEINEDIDRVLFEEDYPQAEQPEDRLVTNISEQEVGDHSETTEADD